MSETEAPLLQLNGVSVVYDGHAVIDDLSLEVGRGEFVVIHGSTGCGKSTILRLFAGLIDPTKGEVVVAGDRIDEFDEAQRRWLRRSMGRMMQEELLLEDRTVLENVMLPALAADETAQEARRRALLALNKCGAADLADLRPSSLSAGQRQIACLARAVVNRPVLILADEPATHLDKTNAQTLINLLSAFALAGVTVVAATHIAGTVWNLFCVIMFAMGNAVSIIIGQQLGAGEIEEAKRTDNKLLFFTVVLHIGVGALIAITAPFIPLIYNTTPEVQRLTTELLFVAGAALPIQAFAHVTYFTIRSGGKTFITFLFDCVFTWLIPLPIAFFCSRYTALSIIGIYALVQFADIIKVIIGSILLRSGIWANNVVSDVD